MSGKSPAIDHRSLMVDAILQLESMHSKIDALEIARNEPIAIIGLGCRFPGGIDNPEAFWRVLHDGVDTITETPKDRWNIDEYYDPDPNKQGKIYTRDGGFLSEVDTFDSQFFNISPREALSLDPQQRLLLEVSWEALENAYQVPEKLYNSLTGVFVGISTSDYSKKLVKTQDTDAYYGTGNAFSAAAGRLSYVLGLTGPSLAVDTACSSSLVGVHLACNSLRQQECHVALAGGVNLILSPEASVTFSQAKMLSPDGRCKTFDESANGYVRGEGCGVVVLKRLSDAIADGDSILAVIRGSAVNQDGPSGGLTVPNGPSQQAVIRQALQNGNVNPQDISYIEAHGTGTSLGDPIEVDAIGAVFGKSHSPANPLTIGSLKTNIGHLEAASGIAGLLKVVLQLQHKKIAPHLHFKQPSPYINWEKLPVKVSTQPTEWLSDSPERLAGVSSFGFSGTNAHVILAEAPSAVNSDQLPVTSDGLTERPYHILTLSAKCEPSLQKLGQKYQQFLANNSSATLPDICFTANTRRSHFSHRLAIVAESTQELQQKLQAWSTGEDTYGVIKGQGNDKKGGKIAFLFTGQGSQYVGMGRELYETQPTFRKTIDRCSEILNSYLEQPLLDILYPPPGTNSPINETAYTQPALFAIEYALYQLWQFWGIEPEVVMGHSVGEYVAATVAGVFSLEDGLKLIAHRGRLMQSLPQDGAMVSLLATPEMVIEAIQPYEGEVTIAAFNGATSTVISGEREAVHEVRSKLETEGVKTKTLQVSHGFHSPLMEPMLEDFAQVAQQVNYSLPQIDLISNVTGKLATAEITTPEYWCNHVRQPVKFAQGMNTLTQQGSKILLEIGSQPILLGMGRLCISETDVDNYAFLPSLRPQKSDWQQMLDSLAELYIRGITIDWQSFEQDYPQRSRVMLPTYQFQRQRYWVEDTPNRENALSSSLTPLLSWLHQGQIEKVQSQLEKTETLSANEIQLLPKLLELIAANTTGANNNSINEDVDRVITDSNIKQENPHQPRDKILAAPPDERLQLLKIYFGKLLAKVMKIDPSQLDWQQRLSSLGLDSLMAAELRRQIEEQFNISLPVEFLAELNLEKFVSQLLFLIEKHHFMDDPDSSNGTNKSVIVSKQKIEASPWIVRPQANPQARLRLFCLPYAGAGASVFHSWIKELPPEIELCAIQLPGRESRLQESPLTRLKEVTQVLVPLLEPYLDLPFALFGHSLGALLSFELVRELRRQNYELPTHLFVSGKNAPQLLDLKPPIHRLPDAKFIEKIKGYNGTPDKVLQDTELMQQFLPVLRADMAILETYFYGNEAPLNCPITAFGGLADPEVSRTNLAAWEKQTEADFDIQMFTGNHFFLNSARQKLLQAISTRLEQQLLILN